jgi:hypothetical protein
VLVPAPRREGLALTTDVVALPVEDEVAQLRAKIKVANAGARARALAEPVTAVHCASAAPVTRKGMTADIMASAVVVAVALVRHVVLAPGASCRPRSLSVLAPVLAGFPTSEQHVIL